VLVRLSQQLLPLFGIHLRSPLDDSGWMRTKFTPKAQYHQNREKVEVGSVLDALPST
jgi:hypothetical protein